MSPNIIIEQYSSKHKESFINLNMEWMNSLLTNITSQDIDTLYRCEDVIANGGISWIFKAGSYSNSRFYETL